MAVDLGIVMAFATSLIFILGLIVLSTMDPSLRRKVSIIRKNGHIHSDWVNKRNLIPHGGAWWYVVDGFRYLASGPSYTFDYRMVRSFGLKRYVGSQRVYLEGNPVPYAFKEDERLRLLSDTARLLGNAAESDPFDRLMGPRKVDWLILILAAGLAFVVGIVAGGRIV